MDTETLVQLTRAIKQPLTRLAKLEDSLTVAHLLHDELEAENARLREECESLRAGFVWAEDIVARGVKIMTPTQLGQWEGVRAWQEFGDDPAMNVQPIPAEVADVVKAAIEFISECKATGVFSESIESDLDHAINWLSSATNTLLASPAGAGWRVEERDGE